MRHALALCLVACGSSAAVNPDAGRTPDATPPADAKPDPCVQAGNCPPGVWENVTPSDVNLTDQLSCSNYGTTSVQVDPAQPSDLYAQFNCQGIWKSTDYGQTWTGPINTGTNGASVGDCAGGITIAPGVLYQACIRGAGTGFWRSTNGGVDWTNYAVTPGGDRQDFYPPAVDPHDPQHLIITGHEMNVMAESTDGGQTWQNVNLDPGMMMQGGTAFAFFVDTGSASTTAKTWLWIAQQSTMYGTWRTTDSGVSWTKVDKNEHLHGSSQIFQPDTSGVVYMAGVYSDLGWGLLRSADYGQTWTHVGVTGLENLAYGTSKNVYASADTAAGLGSTQDPSLEIAPLPAGTDFTQPGTPAGMTQGPAQVAVTNDGQHNILVGACWGAGLWRYIEP